ncbi:MAG TPA: hypothetical protein PLA01_07695, partial [Acetivibrio sp.]|nr:hypothetical protein [Acetivibrio sp.]
MIIRILSSNKGSTLITSILIIIMMSLLGISLMAVTLSSLDMSVFYSDLNRAYFLAEAAAEEVAKTVDGMVGDIQESSRGQVSYMLQKQLVENPVSLRDPDGSVSEGSFETEYRSRMEEEFKSLYFDYFYDELQNAFVDIGELDNLKMLLNTEHDDGFVAYKDVAADYGRMVLESAFYDDTNKTLNIRVCGIYNDYKKRLEVSFGLLPEPDKPPFQVIEKARVKNPVKYNILKKAVVAEKNLIITGGNVHIAGDVLSFGTVPFYEALSPGQKQEDFSAPWYSYGGIMVGMCDSVAERDDEFGFDSAKTGTFAKGSLSVDGNVATMGYIHTLYSSRTDPSSISISGDTYSRSVRSEKYSNYSTMSFGNLSTIDNLQIDSNGSVIDINGVYKGFVDTWRAIDGSSGMDSSEDEVVPKRTSSVVVNGDSLLNFKNAVYIGGSTFLKNLTDQQGNPYMTGISALKSSEGVIKAFLKDDVSNPENRLFWFENGQYVEPFPEPYYKQYSQGENAFDMLSGRASDPGYFPIINRAMHFKKVWEVFWKPDDIFFTNINPDNISITGNGIAEDGRINGFSNGAVIANGRVYGVDDFVDFDPSSFHINIQKPTIENYYDSVSGLLNESYNPEYPKLNFVEPTKNVTDYIDGDFIGRNRVELDKPYIPMDVNKGLLYYGTKDVRIERAGVNWYIDGNLIPVAKGIILTDGNIYIEDGFSFTGILLSTKNIVF